MKKSSFKKVLTGMAIAGVALLAACGSGASGKTDDSSGKAKDKSDAKDTMAVVIPSAEHGWMAGVAYYAEQKVDELGLKDCKIVTSTNVNEQASQLDELISQKVGAIVLQPHTDEVSVAAKKVVDAGIPLVVFDRKVDADYTSFIAGSNPQIGEESAKVIGDELGGKGTVAVLSVPSSGSVSAERVDAFNKKIKADYPDIKTVDMTADDFTQEGGLKCATDMLTANKHVDAVFSIDDESSLGILQAIKDSKRDDIKIISGAGGNQAYFKEIEGNADIKCFTATYSPAMIGDAIEAAKKILDGKDADKNQIIPPTIVNKDNVKDFIDADSPY